MAEGTIPETGAHDVTETLPAYGADVPFGPDGPLPAGGNGRRPTTTLRGRTIRAMRRHVGRVALVVLLVLAGAGVGTWLLTRSSGPAYVLTSAGTGTVQQTVSATSTVEAANQAMLNFATSGRVTAVDVVVGQ